MGHRGERRRRPAGGGQSVRAARSSSSPATSGRCGSRRASTRPTSASWRSASPPPSASMPFPGRSFAGRIAEIRKTPQVLQNVVTYIAVIAADNRDLRLLPGMTASVDLVVKTASSVLRVPNAALQFRSGRCRRRRRGRRRLSGRVWRLDSTAARSRVAVGLGVSDDAHTEVTGGGLCRGRGDRRRRRLRTEVLAWLPRSSRAIGLLQVLPRWRRRGGGRARQCRSTSRARRVRRRHRPLRLGQIHLHVNLLGCLDRPSVGSYRLRRTLDLRAVFRRRTGGGAQPQRSASCSRCSTCCRRSRCWPMWSCR